MVERRRASGVVHSLWRKRISFHFKGLLCPKCQRMEKILRAGVVMCRPAVVVSTIFLLSCGFLQLARAQANQSNIVLNIACGATQSYTDPVTGLTWVPDTAYINTGKAHTSLGAPSSPPNASGMSSLRYFDDQRLKNCYSLPVIASSYYMIRASFFYGNYDQNAKPPSFQLAMDGNIVANITMTDSTSGQYVEFQYVPLYSNTLFLCLIRTSSLSTPFISGITLVQVSDFFKRRPNSADDLNNGYILKTITRVNYGGTNLIRYPTDSHDFMWHPQGANSALLKLTTSPIQVLSTTDTIKYDDIPPPVMQTAVTTSGENLTSYIVAQGSLDVGWPNADLLTSAQSLYVNWAELSKNVSVRRFEISSPVVPTWTGPSQLNGSYLSTMGYAFTDWDFSTSGPNDTFTLTKTNISSTLGPIVNALEFYSKSDSRVLKTSSQDALEIEKIEGILNLTEWTGDPCVPYPHTWLTCATIDGSLGTYENPVVIALNLSGYNLEGTISQFSQNLVNLSSLAILTLAKNKLFDVIPDLSYMTNLITLDLSNNDLSGTIPFWLTSLNKLKHLYLEGNNFYGPIPDQLLQNDTLDFVYFPGNSGLTGGVPLPSSNSKSNSRTLAILGATLGSALGFLILANLTYCLYPSLKIQFSKLYRRNNPDSIGASGAKIYTLAEVTAMTRNFNQEIGKGGFGPVYYGKLPDGQEVAVKVADASSRQGRKEFLNEVDVLSRVRHKNLVALVGYCQEDAQQILIYEYMKNGSVHDQLFGDKVSSLGKLLDWKMRLKIGLDAAQGLEYLHTGCSPSFIHRDVKSSNTLLSAKFDAKVADFGLTKLMGETDDTKVLTLVMGTAGYLDPEYYQSHYLSTKSDIYSFGVVLLELVTGRLPISRPMVSGADPGESNTNLCNWVRATLEDGNLDAVLDPALRASVPAPNQDALLKVTEIALQCVELRSIHRPTMTTVLQVLHVAYDLENPSSPAQDESFGPFDYSDSEMGPLDWQIGEKTEMEMAGVWGE